MRKVCHPLALAGLTVFLSDILMMFISPAAIIPAAAALIFITAAAALKRKRIASVLLLAAVCMQAAGISFNIRLMLYEQSAALSGKNVCVEGRLSDYPIMSESGYSKLLLDSYTVNGKKGSGKIKVYIKGRIKLKPGERVTLSANDIFASESDGVYKYHALSGNEYLTAFSSGPAEITGEQKETLFTRILSLRKAADMKIRRHTDKNAADISSALITGDKTMLSGKIKKNLQISGVSHLFAVSGMHLSLWTGLLFFLMTKRSKTKLLPNLAASGFVIFYMIFTGLSPSVMRAGIMLLTVFAGALIKRRADSLNSLGLAALLLLIINPFLAGNISFLLSFAAAFALIAVAPAVYVPQPQIKAATSLPHKTALAAKSSLYVTFSVMLTTLPLSAIFFGYSSLLTPLSVIVLTPAAEIIMVLCGIGIFLPDNFFVTQAVFKTVQYASHFIINFTDKMQGLDFALFPLNIKIILPWFLITAIISAVLYLLFHKNTKVIICSLLSCSLVLCAITAASGIKHKNDILLYFPQAGSCTCFCGTTPSGSYSFIFGAGGDYTAGQKISRFLSSHSAAASDVLILPRSAASETSNTEYIKKSLFPKNILELFCENKTELFSAKLNSSIELHSEVSDSFSAAALYINGRKLVVCSLPSSDFSKTGDEFTDGDILICRGAVPDSADTNNFKSVIVMSEYIPDTKNKNLRTTANGDIFITLKGDKNAGTK